MHTRTRTCAHTHTHCKYILISWCMQDLIHVGGVSKSNQRPIPDELRETQRSTLSMERWCVAGPRLGFPNHHNAMQSQDIMHRSEPQSHRIEREREKKNREYWVHNSKAWLWWSLLWKATMESQKWENWPASASKYGYKCRGETCLKNCHDQEQYSTDSRQISRVKMTTRCHGKLKKLSQRRASEENLWKWFFSVEGNQIEISTTAELHVISMKWWEKKKKNQIS